MESDTPVCTNDWLDMSVSYTLIIGLMTMQEIVINLSSKWGSLCADICEKVIDDMQ